MSLPKYCLQFIYENPKQIEFKRMWFNSPQDAIDLVREEAVKSGAMIKQVERTKALQLSKEYLDKNLVAPIVDTRTGTIYFYSVELSKVIPFCQKRFRELYKMRPNEFEEILTPVKLIHNYEIPPGIQSKAINCHDASPFIFD